MTNPPETPPVTHRWTRFLIPAAWLLAIYLGSEQNRIPGSPGLPGFDKIAHFGAFGLLATLWINALDRPGRQRRALVLGVLIASLYGAVDEYHQSFSPGRSVEFADWVADTLGALTAALAYRFFPRWRGFLQHGIARRASESDKLQVRSP